MSIKGQFVPYDIALKMKELGFDEPCMYAYCTTPKHLIERKGEVCLRTDGNPFGEFQAGKDWNSLIKAPNKNKILCSAPLYQ